MIQTRQGPMGIRKCGRSAWQLSMLGGVHTTRVSAPLRSALRVNAPLQEINNWQDAVKEHKQIRRRERLLRYNLELYKFVFWPNYSVNI